MKVKEKLLSLAGIAGVIACYFAGLFLIVLLLNKLITPPENQYLRNVVLSAIQVIYMVFFHLLLIKLFGKKERAKYGLEIENNWFIHFFFSIALAAACITIIWSLVLLFGGFKISLILLTKETLTSIFLLFIHMLLVGFQEEILSRGSLAYMGKKGGKYFSTVVICLVFSLSHLGSHGIEGINIIFIINLILFSMVAFLLSWFTGDLWSCVGFHFAWNFVMGGIFGVSISGYKVIGFIVSEIETGNYINGGEYGLEGSILCTIILLLLITGIQIMLRKKNKV